MKSFLDFLKEEATFRGNKGIPGEGPEGRNEPSFLGGVDAEGRRKAQGNPMQIGGRMMQLMDSNKSLIRGKQDEIEKFAEKIIRDVYSGFMDNVDLDIKLVRDGNEIKDFMDEENEKKEERNKKEKDKKNKGEEKTRPSNDPNLKLEIDKRKLANAITQGEAKNTKEIIRMPECLEGLKKILGDRNGEQLHRQLLEMTELADKMDWIIPIEVKADMMERAPQGLAGACSVDWQEDEDEDEDEKEDAAKNVLDELQNKEEGSNLNEMSDELEELFSSGKPVIRARGIDFVMLIHEAVKGIYELIASRGIPEDQELASNVFLNTETFADEAEDFRYGPAIAGALRNFIVSNRKVDKFPNVREYVYGKMIELPAEEFLKLMKGILMMTPEARKEVDLLIDEVIDELESYERELNDYEMGQRFGVNEPEEDSQTPELSGDEEDDDITSLMRRTTERESDYSNMSPREINDLIDQALDKGDFARVKMLSGYLPKESASIYLNELKRINESKRR